MPSRRSNTNCPSTWNNTVGKPLVAKSSTTHQALPTIPSSPLKPAVLTSQKPRLRGISGNGRQELSMDWVRMKNEWFLLHESISFGVIPGINTCSIYDNLGLFLCLTRSFLGLFSINRNKSSKWRMMIEPWHFGGKPAPKEARCQ